MLCGTFLHLAVGTGQDPMVDVGKGFEAKITISEFVIIFFFAGGGGRLEPFINTHRPICNTMQ